MLGKNNTKRKPFVILGSIVLLLLLNVLVVNNPAFATLVGDIGKPAKERAKELSPNLTPAERNAELANLGEEITKEVDVFPSDEEVEHDTSSRGQLKEGMRNFWMLTGFRNCRLGNLIMILIGILFIFLAVKFEFEPMLLIPIGTGIICGNIPFFQGGGINLSKAYAMVESVDLKSLELDAV